MVTGASEFGLFPEVTDLILGILRQVAVNIISIFYCAIKKNYCNVIYQSNFVFTFKIILNVVSNNRILSRIDIE